RPIRSHALLSSTDQSPPEIYTLSLHDALPIYNRDSPIGGCEGKIKLCRARYSLLHSRQSGRVDDEDWLRKVDGSARAVEHREVEDRKSTRLNSSHVKISYAVFCLKKKKQKLQT